MGTYLNPGKQGYQMVVNSDIFIDKSAMIQYLNSVVNTEQRFVSVSRPRRFGKSIAADMICAYYDRESDSRDIFKERRLSECPPIVKGSKTIRWDEYLGKFDVIRIVMTKFLKKKESVSTSSTHLQLMEVRHDNSQDKRTRYSERSEIYR